jgi:hypothetical protein
MSILSGDWLYILSTSTHSISIDEIINNAATAGITSEDDEDEETDDDESSEEGSADRLLVF